MELKLEGKKRIIHKHTRHKKINEHTQITYITINLTYSDLITGNSSVYVRNGIKVNTQTIHTEKKIHLGL